MKQLQGDDRLPALSPSTSESRKTLRLAKRLRTNPDLQAWAFDAMFALSDISDDPRTGSKWFYTETIRILSNSPAAPAIRLAIEGCTYESKDFSECSQPEIAQIVVSGEGVGRLELHFPTTLSKCPDPGIETMRRVAMFAAHELSHITSSKRMTHVIDTLCRHQLTVLDSISEPIYVVCPREHTIIWSNEAFNKIWGHSAGRKCYEVVFNQNSHCAFCPMPASETLGHSQVFEFEHHRSGLWFRNISKIVYWPDGRLVACHIAVDITQRKVAEKKLWENEHVLNEAQRMALTGSWQIDIRDRMMKMSPTMMDIYGVDSDVITTDQAIKRIHPDDRDRIREAFDQALRGDSVSLEYCIIRSDGELRYVITPAAQMFNDEAGQPTKLVGVTRDITDHKDQEKALRNANERLETGHKLLTEKNIALSQVLNQIEEEKRQIAHQIQANVDRIIMPLVRKFDEKLQPAEREYLDMLRTSLEDITSPFANEMQAMYSHLSPREIEICNMIRNGQTSKDIAAAFDTSLETVRKQRQNIRRKLNLTNSNTNLSSFLQSL
ncbi:MAG: PAS domain-containing protein [candidate division Zixibacteria bacterium]|nr:PAS domain-containing protein [candidate division Zixibacteria bacterium]